MTNHPCDFAPFLIAGMLAGVVLIALLYHLWACYQYNKENRVRPIYRWGDTPLDQIDGIDLDPDFWPNQGYVPKGGGDGTPPGEE